MDFYITANIGTGSSALTSFDNALLNSGVANYNLVRISSILPPNSKLQKSVNLSEGSVLHTAYVSVTTNRKDMQISAAIAVGIPKDKSKIGVIMEFSDYCDKLNAEKCVKRMVEEAMNSRGYDIKDILFASVEACGDGEKYVTAFAALSIW